MKRIRNNRFEIIDELFEDCCTNPKIEIRDGNYVCLSCGMIITRRLVENEMRAFTADEISKRRRTEITWRTFGPRTIISKNKRDIRGNKLNADTNALFSRLAKIQKSFVNSIERNFHDAHPKLQMLSSKMGIPDFIRDTAKKIYTVIAKRKLTMGRSIEGFIVASLYAAIRIHEFPLLMEEVCEICMIPRKTVHHHLAIILKKVLSDLKLKYKPITAEQLVFRFGNDLGLPMETQKKAINMLVEASKNGLLRTGKDPKGLAASVIYMAAKAGNHRKTQAEVSEIAKVTEVTLRSRSKQIKSKLQ